MSKKTRMATRCALSAAITVAIALAATGCGASAGSSDAAPPASAEATAKPAPLVAKTGDIVAAPWGGGMYIGNVTAVKGDKADVLYKDDNVNREVPLTDLVVVTVKVWKPGDKVMAVWGEGRFYPGLITAAKPDEKYTIDWDDDDTPTDVDASLIYGQ